MALPQGLNANDLEKPSTCDIFDRIAGIEDSVKLMSSDVFLEYFLISFRFACHVSPKCLKLWMNNFPSSSDIPSLLWNHYSDVMLVCFAAARVAMMNFLFPEGLKMLQDLLHLITPCKNQEMSLHFIRLLFIGEPSIISLMSLLNGAVLVKSFLLQCIKIRLAIFDETANQYHSALMSLYLKVVQMDAIGEMDLPSLKLLFHPHIDGNLKDSYHVIQLIANGVLRTPGCKLYSDIISFHAYFYTSLFI